MRITPFFGALLAAAAMTAGAGAYHVEGVIAEGCHEHMTAAALRSIRAHSQLAPPIAPNADEEALIDDVPFGLAGDTSDLAAVTLLLGVRDPDLKGHGAEELDALAGVHGDPARQHEHCLRASSDDEPDGAQRALDRCRSYVRERFAAALEGLDASGRPDPSRRETLEVTLAIRGRVEVPLPAFWVRIGQTVHAVQDAFSHSYRTADGLRVTTVSNWIDVVDDVHEERRDGPAHALELDRCDDPDELRTLRRELATRASIELLRAALDPELTPEEKKGEADVVLDRYLGFSPGCTYDNRWCDAPERAYADARCACRAGPAPENRAALLSAGALLLAAWTRRRRGARSSWRAHSARGAAALAAAVVFASAAEAEGSSPVQSRDAALATPAATADAPSALGVHVAFAGAYDSPALAGSIGGRYRLDDGWIVGLDAEYNPFLSFTGDSVRRGVANGYATLVRRWIIGSETFALRTHASAGTSVLMMNLYGAPAGSVGIYLGAGFLGVEWKVARGTYVVIDPLHLSVPVPQLEGIPFAYRQYRATLGVEVFP